MSRRFGELVLTLAAYGSSAGLLLACSAEAGPLKLIESSDNPEGSGGRVDSGSGGNRTGGATSGGGGNSTGGQATGGTNSGGTTTTGGASPTGGNSTGGTPGNATGGASPTGGSSTGGTPGNATGGASMTGGNSTGGTPGNATGGASTTGGQATGGANTGGTSGASTTGGQATGGTATGGSATGGTSTGGKATGGTSTGGKATGGTSTGGTATGGSATGGSSSTCQNFSFFVTSMAAIVRVSGSSSGFGGDLRHGQADGLAGADKICAEIAATSLSCASTKTWRAFLSTSSVDAIDRIGSGPWYDRNGLKVWNALSEMTADRPPTTYLYRDDLPNEDGTPNHDYDLDGTVADDDNHDFLTGSGTNGRKVSSDTAAARCSDWTSTTASGPPWCGHSWPRQGSGTHWIHSIQEGGCGAGIVLSENSVPFGCSTVGCGGGYGGIYCFALTP